MALPDRSFFQTGRYLLLFGFLSVFLGNFGQSFFIGSYGSNIQLSLGLSASSYGMVYSIATVISGTGIMFIGGYIDKVPLQRFVIFVVIGLCLGCLLMVASSNLWILGIAFFAIRLCGQGLLPHTGITTMARCFDANRGKAISIAASGVPAGEVVLPLLAAVLIAQVGWQQSWLLIAICVPAVFLPLALWLLAKAQRAGFSFTPAQAASDAESVNASGRREVIRDSRFWLVVPALIAAPFVVTGLFIHQGFFMQQKHWSLELFASSFVVYGIVHWLSSLLAGVLVDRFTAVRIVPFFNIPLALSMFVMAFFSGPWVAFLMLAFVGMTIGFGGPVAGALWAEVYGTAKLGSIRSMMTSIMVWSTAISPVAWGLAIDHGVTAGQLASIVGVAVCVSCVIASFGYSRTNRLEVP